VVGAGTHFSGERSCPFVDRAAERAERERQRESKQEGDGSDEGSERNDTGQEFAHRRQRTQLAGILKDGQEYQHDIGDETADRIGKVGGCQPSYGTEPRQIGGRRPLRDDTGDERRQDDDGQGNRPEEDGIVACRQDLGKPRKLQHENEHQGRHGCGGRHRIPRTDLSSVGVWQSTGTVLLADGGEPSDGEKSHCG